MMSQWNLNQLILRWKQIEIPVCLIVGENDNIVQNNDNLKASKEIPKAKFIINANQGHLMHEEDPELISKQILSFSNFSFLPYLQVKKYQMMKDLKYLMKF